MTGFNVKNWFGVVAPARTPNEIINKIANEIIKIQGMTDVKEKLAMQGVQPFINGSNAFTQFLKLEIEKYGRIVKAANIKIEY
jgi:tripartite-type tricarboxylate transporter receptor subunit TctC